jgi:hypothetical protein
LIVAEGRPQSAPLFGLDRICLGTGTTKIIEEEITGKGSQAKYDAGAADEDVASDNPQGQAGANGEDTARVIRFTPWAWRDLPTSRRATGSMASN